MKKRYLILTLPLLAVSLLQGCAPVVVGGAATGASVVHDRRTAGTAIDDQSIELKALSRLTNNADLNPRVHVSATSYNRVVLLTGQADDEDARGQYVEMVRTIPMVKRVVNEVQIGPGATLSEQSSDAFITSKVKLELFNIKLPEFDPTRVKVVTEKGVVYLMGLLRANEADAVVEKVRYLRGVKQVVKVFEYL